ncbi:unnamed protein product [Amoebophrya sp. A25]|nr:unnamed protein product [Amoebophrya sp. A25]|eukprot:GSA25T00001774001.1
MAPVYSKCERNTRASDFLFGDGQDTKSVALVPFGYHTFLDIDPSRWGVEADGSTSQPGDDIHDRDKAPTSDTVFAGSSPSSSSSSGYSCGFQIGTWTFGNYARKKYERFVELGLAAPREESSEDEDHSAKNLRNEKDAPGISVLTKRPIEEEIRDLPLPLFVLPTLASSYFLYGKWLFGTAAGIKTAAAGGKMLGAKGLGGLGPFSLLWGMAPGTVLGENSLRRALREPDPGNDSSIYSAIFPNFKGDTFLKRICVLQILEYIGSLFLTMGSNVASSPVAQTLGANLALSPNTCSLYLLGASWGPSIALGEVWRLITPMMLHANGLHIFFNLFFQSRVGFGIEEQLGTRKFMILYLFCGYFGNLVSILVDPYKLAVGASTSAFGLLGVWFSEVHLTWHLLSEDAKGRLSFWFGGMLLALVVMSNLAPHLDMWGHVGGLLGGYLMSMCLADMSVEHRPPWYATGQKLAQMALAWSCFLGTAKVVFLNPVTPIPNCGTLLHPKNILM